MACITKRRGRYVIDCYDQNGKRYRKSMKAGTAKDAAKRELREIEAKIERRTFMHEKKALTFKEVAQKWLEYKKGRCRITSWEMFESYLKNHFVDIDELKINRITTANIESFITARQSKMALASLRKILVTLNQVMKYAVRHRMIDYNPLMDAERPKATGKAEESRAILTPKQIRGLIEAEPDQKYKTLFLTAIMTGARQGEILGLKWSDVNFAKKQINISRTFNHGRFFEPKTRQSMRKIDLAPMLVKALAAWKLRSGGKDDDLVFYCLCNDNEKLQDQDSEIRMPMNYSNMVQRHFLKALKKAEIPRIRFHDLRHTFASLLIEQGENIKYIQSQLGHSTPVTTLTVYAHLMKETNQEAARRLEKAIFKGTGHKMVTKKKKGITANG